jgi:hypothetical protein
MGECALTWEEAKQRAAVVGLGALVVLFYVFSYLVPTWVYVAVFLGLPLLLLGLSASVELDRGGGDWRVVVPLCLFYDSYTVLVALVAAWTGHPELAVAFLAYAVILCVATCLVPPAAVLWRVRRLGMVRCWRGSS